MLKYFSMYAGQLILVLIYENMNSKYNMSLSYTMYANLPMTKLKSNYQSFYLFQKSLNLLNLLIDI